MEEAQPAQDTGSPALRVTETLSSFTPPQPYRWWKYDVAWMPGRSVPLVCGDDELLRVWMHNHATPPPFARSFGTTMTMACAPWYSGVVYSGTAGWLMGCLLPDGESVRQRARQCCSRLSLIV